MRIETEEEYDAAFRELNDIMGFDVPLDSVVEATEEELDRLEELVTAIDAYEQSQHPIEPPSTAASVEYHYDRVRGTRLNPLIAVAGIHPDCAWVLRKATPEEKAKKGSLDYVLGLEGVDLYATAGEALEFLEWLS